MNCRCNIDYLWLKSKTQDVGGSQYTFYIYILQFLWIIFILKKIESSRPASTDIYLCQVLHLFTARLLSHFHATSRRGSWVNGLPYYSFMTSQEYVSHCTIYTLNKTCQYFWNILKQLYNVFTTLYNIYILSQFYCVWGLYPTFHIYMLKSGS